MKTHIIIRIIQIILVFLILGIIPKEVYSQPNPPSGSPYTSVQITTIKTPKGEDVQAKIYSGTSAEWFNYFEQYGAWLISSHNWTTVTRLAAATMDYNCHSYAWYVSEGGSNVWIDSANTSGTQNLSKFWTGLHSYKYCGSTSIGRKIRYSNDDHSAITTGTAPYFKSKWGSLPLYQHYYNECPYTSSNLLYYELDPNMTGITSNLCYNTERNFNTNITNMSGATLTWTPGSCITYVSGAGTPQYTIKGLSNGSTYVNFQITTPSGFTWSSSKSFWAGLFNNTWVSGTVAVCPNITYTYTALVPGGHSPSYTYYWTYPSGWNKISQYQNTIQLRTTSTPIGGAVRVSINNECGTSAYSGITVYPGSCYYYYSMYPNPASDEVTISINETEAVVTEDTDLSDITITKAISSDQIIYTIRIYNSIGTLVSTATRTGTSFNIPLPNLRDGTYIVEVRDGKNNYREPLIIKHD